MSYGGRSIDLVRGAAVGDKAITIDCLTPLAVELEDAPATGDITDIDFAVDYEGRALGLVTVVVGPKDLAVFDIHGIEVGGIAGRQEQTIV